MSSGAKRTIMALSGRRVSPPACGVTFIDPEVLAETGSPDESFPEALARLCRESRLDFAFVPSWQPWAPRLLELLRDIRMAAMWVAPGVLGPALDETGHVEGLRAAARDAGRLAPALDRAAGAMVAAVRRGVELGADAIVVADDLAAERGPLLPPSFLAHEILARSTAAIREAAGAGLPALLHSDGDTGPILADIRAAGFAGVHVGGLDADAFERLCGPMRRQGLAVLGGVPSRGLANGTEWAVGVAVRASILATGGGVLIADDGGISTPADWRLSSRGWRPRAGAHEELEEAVGSALTTYSASGPPTAGQVRRATSWDLGLVVVVFVVLWPAPALRLTLGLPWSVHIPLALGTLVVTCWLYALLCARLLGRTLGMYLADVGFAEPGAVARIGTAERWALGWAACLIPGVLGVRGPADSEGGWAARFSGLSLGTTRDSG